MNARLESLLSSAPRYPQRIICMTEETSWCGRKAKREKIVSRPGWAAVRAVVEDQLHEVKSSFILQPGPAALTDGVDQLARGEKLPPPRQGDLRAA
jgi:iron complex transport system substrate-binding protein